MGHYGIKMTKPGQNVNTASIRHQWFNSLYPFLKIKSFGSGSEVLTDSDGVGFNKLLYTHSLGYNPMAFVYAAIYDSFSDTEIAEYQRMPITALSAGALIGMHYVPIANTTELRFSAETFGGDAGNHTIFYHWVVYYDPE